MDNYYQKGVSALFAVLILSVMLTVVLGVTTIVATQIKTIKVVGDSVVAFYAADAGVEYMLKLIINGDNPPPTKSANVGSGISYTVNTVCCAGGDKCVFLSGSSCPGGLTSDSDCMAPRYCVRSTGLYSSSGNKSIRAIEVEI